MNFKLHLSSRTFRFMSQLTEWRFIAAIKTNTDMRKGSETFLLSEYFIQNSTGTEKLCIFNDL